MIYETKFSENANKCNLTLKRNMKFNYEMEKEIQTDIEITVAFL